MSVVDEFRTFTRAAIKQLLIEALVLTAHSIAHLAGPRVITGRQRTRRLWRRRGRR